MKHWQSGLGLAVWLFFWGPINAISPAHEKPGMAPAPAGMTHHPADHHHPPLEVSGQQPIPTVQLKVHPDPKGGWNLEVQVSHFRFAPERVNSKSVTTTEGHAHLYIDGQKVTRLYGSWYYLPKLAAGQRQLTVSLNANGHEALLYKGQPIAATVTVQAP